MNAVERELVPTRVLNPIVSEVSYKPKQRSYRKIKLKRNGNSPAPSSGAQMSGTQMSGAQNSSAQTAAPKQRRPNVPDPTHYTH